jgi:membrane-associated phospholipid phosphatase
MAVVEQSSVKLKVPRFLQLKYSFIPIMLLIICSYIYIDEPVERLVISLSTSEQLFFQIATSFGNSSWIIVLCALIVLICIFTKKRENKSVLLQKAHELNGSSIFILTSVVVSGLFVQVIKCIIGRARPTLFEEFGSAYFNHFHLFDNNFSSMPSGHSTTIGSLFVCLIFLAPKYKYLWVSLALFFALTRVFVQAHYPSDIIFGLALGSYTSVYLYSLFITKKWL